MITWTNDKPTKPGKYLFLHFIESPDPEFVDVIQTKDGLQGFDSHWKWFEPLYNFADYSMWSTEPVNFPEYEEEVK